MKTIFSFFMSLLAIVLMTSCAGKFDKESYNQVYDVLFTEYIDIDEFASKINIPAENLAKTRFGVMEAESDLLDFMNGLLEAYQKFDHKKVEKILKKGSDNKFKFETQDNVEQSDLKSNYIQVVYARNEKFDSELPQLAGNTISNELQKYVDKEFAWYRFPINAWNYLWKGKEKMQSKYHKEFYQIIDVNQTDKFIVKRFNSYSNLLKVENKALFESELEIPVLKAANIENPNAVITKELETKVVDRAALDLLDTILMLIEELGFGLLIWYISQWVIRNIYKYYEKQQIGYIQGAGWWNVLFIATDIFNSYERESQLETARTVTKWIRGLVTVGFGIYGYFKVIKPQSAKEEEIIAAITSNIYQYVEGIDLPIISFFNNILSQI